MQYPKEVEVEMFGRKVKQLCMCKCMEQAYNAEQEHIADIQRNEEISRNRNRGILDIDMMKCTFESDDKANVKISGIARRYVEHFQKMKANGRGLLFFGDTGVGKSFIAACIANALIDKGYKCLVTNFPRIINELSGLYEGKQEYINDLNRYELLVIDDLAIERDTEYTAEIVQNVVDSRYRAGLPMIVTTNLKISDLLQPHDIRKKRLYSRLKEMCLMIEVSGEDRREKQFYENYAEYKNLLGL
jgi:DNA replication protein DnaC